MFRRPLKLKSKKNVSEGKIRGEIIIIACLLELCTDLFDRSFFYVEINQFRETVLFTYLNEN